MSIAKASEHLPKRNPLELTPQERHQIDEIKLNTFYGTTKQILQKVKFAYRDAGYFFTSEDEQSVMSYPAFGMFGKSPGEKDRIFINVDNLPNSLWPSALEHEAVERYFLQHETRAWEIVKEIGLEGVAQDDRFNSVAHYAGLYFELKLANEQGVLNRARAYTTALVSHWIRLGKPKDEKNVHTYARRAAAQAMQLAGRDIVIDYLKKHPSRKNNL